MVGSVSSGTCVLWETYFRTLKQIVEMNVATLILFFLIPLIFLLENVNDETYLKPI